MECATAERVGADVVIVGRHSRSRASQLFLGSVSGEVLARSRRPPHRARSRHDLTGRHMQTCRSAPPRRPIVMMPMHESTSAPRSGGCEKNEEQLERERFTINRHRETGVIGRRGQ
jgi:hypothetical protein